MVTDTLEVVVAAGQEMKIEEESGMTQVLVGWLL